MNLVARANPRSSNSAFVRFRGVAVVGTFLVLTVPGGGRATPGQVSARWQAVRLPCTQEICNVNGINEAGLVIGSDDNYRRRHAVVWAHGQARDLTPASTLSSAAAVNVRGQVVGTRFLRGDLLPRDAHTFLWQAGRFRLIAFAGASASDINDRGVIVGARTRPTGTHAFLWRTGRMVDLGTLGGRQSRAVAINERDHVVGSSTTASGRLHAFIWRGGRLVDLGTLPGDTSSEAVALNDRDQVIGVSGRPSGATRGFLWQNGRISDLGGLGGRITRPAAINGRGQITGSSQVGSGAFHAFLWQNGLLRNLGAGEAVAINNRGQVAGAIPMSGASGWTISHACVWQDGRLTDLGASVGRATATRSVAINDSAVVVGETGTNSEEHTGGYGSAYLWSPVSR